MPSDSSSFKSALRFVRNARHVPQEQFDTVSSRTYVSALERGIKIPTVTKVDELARVLEVHPLTLLAFAYVAKATEQEVEELLAQVRREAHGLLQGEAYRP